MRRDCVHSGQQASLSTGDVTDSTTPIEPGFLLDFCNSLSPNMYEPQLCVGLIAERAQEQLTAHSPPTTIIGARFEASEKGGDTEQLLGFDYSRLTVALLGAVKELTNLIAQVESQL